MAEARRAWRVELAGVDPGRLVLVDETGIDTRMARSHARAERAGVRRSPAALCRALRALGLVRKKRRSGPPSRTARTWPKRGGSGGTTWAGSTPAG